MSKTDVIILAGAPASSDMAPEGGHTSRAMINLGGRTMLQWVVDALRGSESIGRIIAVGDVEAEGLHAVLEPADDLVANLKRGIDSLDTKEPVLVVSSDIPLLTPEAVDDFLRRARAMNPELAYPIVPRSHCEKRYPGLQRTYLKTADGVFTGGNLMLLSSGFLTRNYDTIVEVCAARKHIGKLARIIGLGVLVRVMIGQVLPWVLPVSALEKAVSRMVGGKVAAVVSAYPEIGEDVDKPSDLAAVKAFLLESDVG